MTELNITKQKNFLLGGGGIINYVCCKLFCRKSSCYNRLRPVICTNKDYITEQEREAVLKMFQFGFVENVSKIGTQKNWKPKPRIWVLLGAYVCINK